jgi:hypothetical protein
LLLLLTTVFVLQGAAFGWVGIILKCPRPNDGEANLLDLVKSPQDHLIAFTETFLRLHLSMPFTTQANRTTDLGKAVTNSSTVCCLSQPTPSSIIIAAQVDCADNRTRVGQSVKMNAPIMHALISILFIYLDSVHANADCCMQH